MIRNQFATHCILTVSHIHISTHHPKSTGRYIYKAICCYFRMTVNYLKHIEGYRDTLNTHIDDGIRKLMRGKYEEANENFKDIADNWPRILNIPRPEKRDEWHVIAQTKRACMRAIFGHGFADELDTRKKDVSMEDINGAGYHIFEGYATNKNADVEDYERYEYLGRGIGELSLIRAGIQILLDSKYKNLDACLRNITVNMKVARPRLTPGQFGYDKSLERVSS